MTLKQQCYNLTRKLWDFNNKRARHEYHMWMISHLGLPFKKVPESDCRLLLFLLEFKRKYSHCPIHQEFRSVHRRRIREKQGGHSWTENRAAAIARDSATCQSCHKPHLSGHDLTVDHVIPLFAGGTSDLANLETLCFPCHSRKHKENNEDYRAWEMFKNGGGLERQLRRIRALNLPSETKLAPPLYLTTDSLLSQVPSSYAVEVVGNAHGTIVA